MSAAAGEAARPTAEQCAAWLDACQGDEYAALLCATAQLATETYDDTREAIRRGELIASAALDPRRIRDETRADLADYYGDVLADQAPAVLRAAGFRV